MSYTAFNQPRLPKHLTITVEELGMLIAIVSSIEPDDKWSDTGKATIFKVKAFMATIKNGEDYSTNIV
jgi:hypothetical protein